MKEIKNLILEKIKLELNHITEQTSIKHDKDLIENAKMLSETYKNLKEEN